MVYLLINFSDDYRKKVFCQKGGSTCYQEIKPGQKFLSPEKTICTLLISVWCILLKTMNLKSKVVKVQGNPQTQKEFTPRRIHLSEGLIETDKIITNSIVFERQSLLRTLPFFICCIAEQSHALGQQKASLLVPRRFAFCCR